MDTISECQFRCGEIPFDEMDMLYAFPRFLPRQIVGIDISSYTIPIDIREVVVEKEASLYRWQQTKARTEPDCCSCVKIQCTGWPFVVV